MTQSKHDQMLALVEHFKNDQPVTQDMQSTMIAEEMQLAADTITAALDEIDRLAAERDEARSQVAMAYEAARLEGWRAGLDAAAELCDDTAMRKRDSVTSASLYAVSVSIRALPEPEEAFGGKA